jgi:Cu(I)/Ag(I) efflux system membrane fusion protein
MLVFILALFIFAPMAKAGENDMPGMQMPEKPAPLTDAEQSAPKEAVYICPMHPHIHGKKGDHCPICGMTLVPQAQSEIPSAAEKEGSLRIDPVYRQALGVKTTAAALHEFGKTIRATGNIAPDTRREYTIALRKQGWIDDLPASAIGDAFKKGDLLFTLHSPDLMVVQSEYLIARKNLGTAADMHEHRLRTYGMDDKAIAELKKKGSFLEATPFYAPADGVVTALNIRKGALVPEGGTVLTLQDFSKVWVNARVPVRDMQFLTAGTPATVTIDGTGETYKTSVDYIHPVTDPDSRNGMVRLILDNPDGKLKSDMLASVVFETESLQRLAVPEESVLHGKGGAYVIESLNDGYFRPVMVTTGITAKGMTEILSGLSEAQNIVSSGQFMIDAESSLQGGMAGMSHEH